MAMKMKWSLNDEGRMVASWVNTDDPTALKLTPGIGDVLSQTTRKPAGILESSIMPTLAFHMDRTRHNPESGQERIQRRFWRLQYGSSVK